MTVKLYDHFKESRYPTDQYRQEVESIHGVIKTHNSLLVLGISGSGKSNLLRYLVSNPGARSEDTLFVYVDCNGLDPHQPQAALQEDTLAQVARDLSAQWPAPLPDGPVKQALRLWMAELSKNGPAHLVIVFDRSELLQQWLEVSFFDYLRALRDVNPRLSFIFGGRRLEAEGFGELADVFWQEPYWVGVLSPAGARQVIKRHTKRLELQLEPAAADKLAASAGFHPALLRYACELVKAGKVDPGGEVGQIIQDLLAAPVIERQCRDIWQDFDLATQDLLRHVARDEAPDSPATVEWLTRCGILEPGAKGRAGFTSALFKKYVAGLGPPPLRISDGLVFKGSAAINLSREEFRLFATLWDNQPNVVSHDQISQTVWPEVQGEVTPQMITSLVMRLRDKLGDSQYIDSVRGRGYRFNQGTAPLPRMT